MEGPLTPASSAATDLFQGGGMKRSAILGAQASGRTLVPGNPVRDDTSAFAIAATQPFYECRYGRFRPNAKAGQTFSAQDAFVAATQASNLHHKFDRLVHRPHSMPSIDRKSPSATAASSARNPSRDDGIMTLGMTTGRGNGWRQLARSGRGSTPHAMQHKLDRN